jgi:hypothetical protein
LALFLPYQNTNGNAINFGDITKTEGIYQITENFTEWLPDVNRLVQGISRLELRFKKYITEFFLKTPTIYFLCMFCLSDRVSALS